MRNHLKLAEVDLQKWTALPVLMVVAEVLAQEVPVGLPQLQTRVKYQLGKKLVLT